MIIKSFQSELHRRLPRFYPFSNTMATIVQQAGATQSNTIANRPILILHAAPVANSMIEVGEIFVLMPDAYGADGIFSKPNVAEVLVTNLPAAAGLPGQFDYAGLEIGSAILFPFPSPMGMNVIQIRANLKTGAWELVTANTLGGETITTISGAGYTINSHRLSLEYMPGEYARGYVDSVLRAENTTNLPTPDVVNDLVGAGVFLGYNTGSLLVKEVYFHNLYIETIGRL